LSEESGWTSGSVQKSVKADIEKWGAQFGNLSFNEALKKLLEIAKNPPSEECDEYHIARDLFDLLNELCDHDLTIIDNRDKQKLIDEKLRELIESAIQLKKARSERLRWPDYAEKYCPFLNKLEAFSGQCLQDTPQRRYSITPSDCWACLKRRKMQRQREGRYTVQEYINKKLDPNACPDCAGKGTIPHETFERISGRHEIHQETCPKCKGKGSLA